MFKITPIRLEMLTPHHYQSLAIPGGVASLSTYMADRSVVYGLTSALGGMSRSPALPEKDYRRDMSRMDWVASAFEAEVPRLMRPLGRRMTLDHEGGYQKSVLEATGTGNLKTWFFIQEIPPQTVYHGAVFGSDPFSMASQIADKDVTEIIFRVGRHRGGVVRATRGEEKQVRMNLHTGFTAGADVNADPRIRVDIPALWDIQLSQELALDTAADVAADWMKQLQAEAA
jgi:hypothetical protein